LELSVDNELATCGVPASMSCSDNREGGESSKEEKQRDEHKPGPGPSFYKAHMAYITVKPFCSMQSIRKQDKRNKIFYYFM